MQPGEFVTIHKTCRRITFHRPRSLTVKFNESEILRGLVSILSSALLADAASASCPGPLKLGETSLCQLAEGQIDTISFADNLTAGDRFFLRMLDASGFEQLSPIVELIDPGTSSLICSANGSYDAIVEDCTVPTSTSYSVRASDGPPFTDGGAYGLFAQRLNGPLGARNFRYGESVPAILSVLGGVDSYQFTASAGDKILVRMIDTSGFENLSPVIRLFDPDGSPRGFGFDGRMAEVSSAGLPVDGAYTVLSYEGYPFADTGPYSLFIQRLNRPGNRHFLPANVLVPDAISALGGTDNFFFCADPGDQITITMTDESGFGQLNPVIELYDPIGSLIASNGASTIAQVSTTISSSGQYLILAYEGAPFVDTGAYSITYVSSNSQPIACPEAGSILSTILGVTAIGTLSRRRLEPVAKTKRGPRGLQDPPRTASLKCGSHDLI